MRGSDVRMERKRSKEVGANQTAEKSLRGWRERERATETGERKTFSPLG